MNSVENPKVWTFSFHSYKKKSKFIDIMIQNHGDKVQG